MTLDEARAHLGVDRGATVEEIRDAFRRRARAVHPDLHPSADPVDRARLGREFDAAREARDVLVRYTSGPTRTPPAEPQSRADRTSARSHPSPPRPEQKRRSPPPRVTMRFDEFVAWTDAAGFGTGSRSRPSVDWTRIIVWSTLGVLVAGSVGGVLIYASAA